VASSESTYEAQNEFLDRPLLARPQAPEGPPAAEQEASRWCHARQEAVPPEFPKGPITGTLEYLATLICVQYHRASDPRGLKQLAVQREIWIQKLTGQCYKVYFPEASAVIHSRINARDMENKRNKEEDRDQR
jgi:hypothetical protein